MDSSFIHKEAFWLLCDRELGAGIGRHVYSSKLFPDSVIKCESGAGSFQNVIEWDTWDRVKYTDFAKWFAPCEYISACGSVLIQARTTEIPEGKYPKQMPTFLCDFKKQNYGLYKGNVVCHDYGLSLLIEKGLTKRMRNVNWWSA